MIQDSLDFSANIKKVNLCEDTCYLQKIYSSSRTVCLTARLRGKTEFYYLGRGHGVEGFWVTDEKIPVELRRIDRFLEYLRKYLSSAQLLSIKQVFSDRSLHLIYRRYGKESSFIFFWKGRKLYFMNYFFDVKLDKFCMMKSWSGKEICHQKKTLSELEEAFFEVGLRRESVPKEKKPNSSVALILRNEKLDLIACNKSTRKKKSLQRKLKKILGDLESAKDAGELKNKMIAGSIDFEKMGKDLTFKSLTIKFTSQMRPYAKRERAFQKVKSYEKAIDLLKERVRGTEQEIKLLDGNTVNQFEKKVTARTSSKNDDNGRVTATHLDEMSGKQRRVTEAYLKYAAGSDKADDRSDRRMGEQLQKKLKITQPYWTFGNKLYLEKKNKLKQKGVKVYQTKSGLSFALGLNAKGNDYVRSKWGNLDDLWFHLDQYPGAHLVVKEKAIENIEEKSLKVMLSALAKHSGLQSSEVPVVFTSIKNLKGVKGASGKVIYQKAEHIKVLYDKKWESKVE